jgi:hypothetical protein
MLIPKYWEQPELLTDFLRTVKMINGKEKEKSSRTKPKRQD